MCLVVGAGDHFSDVHLEANSLMTLEQKDDARGHLVVESKAYVLIVPTSQVIGKVSFSV